MQTHTKDMHEKEYLFPKDMIFESQVSRLAKLRLGNLVNFPIELGRSCHESNMHHYKYRIAYNM